MLVLLICLVVVNLVVSIALLFRKQDSQVESRFDSLDKDLNKIDKSFREESSKNREENSRNAKELREEVSNSLIALAEMNANKLETLRSVVEQRLKIIQDDNTQKLEQMRATVDSKLHDTLERRLGESFKLVSDKLELVHKGLGEMQTLANGVGDLKKVLTNVKTRGTWGEIQLGNLLDEILSPEQYAKNIVTKKGSGKPVEFAIKLPGKSGNTTWIPIDAKFPKDDYEKLIEAQEQVNLPLVAELGKALENRIKLEAKDIKEKYVDPPNTTNFGILFLPIEGLYAEILRRPGLCDLLQREYKVAVTGPTTIAAFLNSLQMGFATLAIEKRANEVWNLLGAIKTDFSKFGDILDKTHKKLQEASNTIEDAAKKSRNIEKKLKNVQALPSLETVKLLDDIEEDNEVDEEEIEIK